MVEGEEVLAAHGEATDGTGFVHAEPEVDALLVELVETGDFTDGGIFLVGLETDGALDVDLHVEQAVGLGLGDAVEEFQVLDQFPVPFAVAHDFFEVFDVFFLGLAPDYLVHVDEDDENEDYHEGDKNQVEGRG